jgi:tetratricopeptide (TPR) repeat protein
VASGAPGQGRTDGPSVQRVQGLLAQARQQLIRNNPKSAAALVKEVVGLPDCPAETRLEAAKMLAAAGENADAAAAYLSAGLALLYDHGDMARARQAFATAHSLDPQNVDVIFHLGQADVVEGRTQDALAKFIDVLRRSNLKHTPALFEAGCIYQANGQYDQAILAFKKVLDREKHHIQAIVHMGQLHQIKGMLPEAINYYLQAAQMTRETQQIGTTRQILNMVLAIEPSHPRARSMLADLDEKNDEEEAASPQAATTDRAAGPADLTDPSAALADIVTPADVAAPSPAATAQAQTPAGAADAAEMDTEATRVAAATEAAQAELEALQAKIAAAREEHRAQAAAAAEAERVRREVEQATAELDERLRRLQDIVAGAEQEAAAIEARRTSLGELERAAAMMRQAAAEEKARAEAARAEAARAEAETRRLQAEHEAALAELAERRRRAEEELERLEAQVAESARVKDAARERAESSLVELEAKAQALRKRIEADEQRRASAAAAAEDAAKRLAGLEQQIAAAQAKVQTAGADLKDLVEQTRATQAQAADLATRLAELQAGIEAAETRKRNLEDSIARLKPLATAAERRKVEAEKAAADAQRRLEESSVRSDAVEAGRREVEEALAKTKSLLAAAEQRRLQAEAAAEKAEALRAKREHDAEALAARVSALEEALRTAGERAKAAEAHRLELEELARKISEEKAQLAELEAQRAAVRREVDELRAAVEAARETAERAREASAGGRNVMSTPHQASCGEAEAIAAIVPVEVCGEALRTIETLAADGELPIETATHLAGLIHEGRAPQALREARKLANLAALPGPYLLVCGDLARDLGDIAAARQAYDMLVLAAPKKAPLAQARMGELFLAFAQQSTAAALARDDAHFTAVTDPHKAVETYAELVARFPDDPVFREELGLLHAQLGNETAASLALIRAMEGYLGNDDVAHAVALAPKLLALRRDDGAAWELAAKAYERAGRPVDARQALDQALHCYQSAMRASDVERVCRRLAETADDPVQYRKLLAGLLREADDSVGAAEQLCDAAESLIGWSRAAEAAVLLDEAMGIAGRDAAVAGRVEVLRERASGIARAVDEAARGDLLVGKGDYLRAIDAYKKALQENPHDANVAYQLACLLMDHTGDNAEAEKLFVSASELRPHHAATRYRLAVVKAARGEVAQAVELLIALARFDEANADFIEQFVERLEKDAERGDAAAKYRLGIAYRELGRVDEALVILQSIQREPEYVVLCHNAIGLCLQRQGLDTAAAKRFSKAIETPGYPEWQYHEALYNLGALHEAKDAPESLAQALSSYEELYASDCTYKDVADRIKAVKARLGATDRPKVKRLPTRAAEHGQ